MHKVLRMGDAAIEAQGLTKSFGDVRALDGIDLRAPAGTILGLLGPNGAGKTTAVRILTTLLPPDGGSAHVAGLDVVKDAAALRAQIGLAGQYAAVDENLTGFENLEMVGRLYHLGRRPARERSRELLGALLAHGRCRPPGEDLLRRHAPQARPGGGARGAPTGAVPRRAHHGARPAQPPSALGDDRGARGRRHDRAAHNPVPRRGGQARGPDCGDRPRPGDRRGHIGRAEEPCGRRAPRGDAEGLRPGARRHRGARAAHRRTTEVRARHPRDAAGSRARRDRGGCAPARRRGRRDFGYRREAADARRCLHRAHRPRRRAREGEEEEEETREEEAA